MVTKTSPDMKRRILLSAATLCVLCAGTLACSATYAADRLGAQWQVAAANDWNSLSDDQKRLLANQRDRWDSYPPQRRERLLRGVQRYESLSPEQQAEIRRAHRRFARMSPQQRRRLRQEYRRVQRRSMRR